MSATRCHNNIDWFEVASTCAKLRAGISCTVHSDFTVGWQYLSKLIDFHDGVRWIIHIPLDYTGLWTTARIADRMSRKVATYKFLIQDTAIPVLDIHGYSINIDPAIRSPYILMTHVHGTLAARLDDFPEINLGIQNLAIDEDGKYYITKDIYIDAGPFKTAEEYYNALSLHRFHDFTKYHFRDNISAGNCPAIHLAFMFNNYMRIYTDCANYHSPFSLVYPGFGVHSIVLDKGNNIICVNNVENIMAAPMPIVTQLPRSHALDLPPLGRKIMFSRRNFESENGIPQYARFVKMFRAEEEQRNSLAPIANCMLSNGARLVEGLNKYSEMSINCSNEWVQNYKYMYHRRQTGKVGEKGVLKILTLDDDREPKVPAGASSLTGPYPEGGEIDDPEAEPESPQSLIVIRRKNIAAYLGLTEAQQQDVMHLHRALRMGSAPMISDTAAWEVLKTKLSMYDHDSVFQPMLVNQAADKPLFGKRSSSWMSNLFRSANKPLVSLQQPNPVKIARMRSLKKAFSSDTFRAPLPAPKTVNNIGRVPIPGRFPTTELETLGRDQTLLRADYAAGRDVTDESDSVVGGFAGLALDDDGETYHDAAVPQGERSHSAISDDMRPLL